MRISLSAVFLVVGPVDGRLGVDGLSQFVQHALGGAPCDGTAYVFCNRRRTRLKVLCWDGTGVWLAQRRLHRGAFVWPRAGDTHVTLDDAQWQWLIAGVDWQRLSATASSHWRV
jgi:transposase